MSEIPQIQRISPAAGIPGGEVMVEYRRRDSITVVDHGLWFGNQRAHVVAANQNRALVVAPEFRKGGEVFVTIGGPARNDKNGDEARFQIGRKLADDMHPVTNPAFDPDDGSLYVTRSGGRGDRLPVTLFRIDANGEVTEVSGDIANPTAIAFDKSGQMFVTSRIDGTVYRLTPFHEAIAVATSLGIATGLAFDSKGRMYVGDRSGTIYRVSGIGEAEEFAHLEPSVSAFHLAFGPDDYLYVTGPTVTSFDVVSRIDPAGRASVFFKGVGRPQGIAFDIEGNLYVAASLRGRRGIVQISPDGDTAEIVVGGMNLVGLAFSARGDMVLVSNDAVYSLAAGIQGTLIR